MNSAFIAVLHLKVTICHFRFIYTIVAAEW